MDKYWGGGPLTMTQAVLGGRLVATQVVLGDYLRQHTWSGGTISCMTGLLKLFAFLASGISIVRTIRCEGEIEHVPDQAVPQCRGMDNTSGAGGAISTPATPN
jgi:hypothetical protein